MFNDVIPAQAGQILILGAKFSAAFCLCMGMQVSHAEF